MSQAFYMEPWPGRPEVCKSADLLAPEGYGKIIGGSERISDHDTLLQRIHDHKLPVENYKWYLDLRKYGTVPHSGFGLGVERTVAWICGTEHIRETNPFPRMLQRNYPQITETTQRVVSVFLCSFFFPALPSPLQSLKLPA